MLEADHDSDSWKFMGWIGTLPDPARERVLAAMREIRATADRLGAEHRALSPRNGEIPAGGAHVTPFARSEALNRFLRGLSIGETPSVAAWAGRQEGAIVIRNWNQSRKDHQVHIWDKTADEVTDFALARILAAARS